MRDPALEREKKDSARKLGPEPERDRRVVLEVLLDRDRARGPPLRVVAGQDRRAVVAEFFDERRLGDRRSRDQQAVARPAVDEDRVQRLPALQAVAAGRLEGTARGLDRRPRLGRVSNDRAPFERPARASLGAGVRASRRASPLAGLVGAAGPCARPPVADPAPGWRARADAGRRTLGRPLSRAGTVAESVCGSATLSAAIE